MAEHRFFTISNPDYNRIVITDGFVSGIENREFVPCRMLWDTGATNTCITHKIVGRLGIAPFTRAQFHNADGDSWNNLYITTLLLPNQVLINNLVTCEIDDHAEYDVLVGMDVISKGDFCISGVGESRTVSFCLPSVMTLDFANLRQD